jgi:hypothetical protein
LPRQNTRPRAGKIQGALVWLQGEGGYRGVIAGSTINVMNTSANTNQNHDITTRTARATKTGSLRRNIAGALLVAAFASTGIGLAATAYADDGAAAPGTDATAAPAVNCQTEPWGFLGAQRRTLCDGPIAHDGSWSRTRTIWVPAHYTPGLCYGGSDNWRSAICDSGRFVDQREISNDTYPVRPETVLPDEPGHLN